jgi:hypothetical protein
MDAPTPVEKPLTKTANARTWKTVCALAHAFLCRGDGPHRVEEGEPWALALIRTASEVLHSQGYGRPIGALDPDWERILIEIARQPSTSDDGCVATICGRVHLSRIPRGL